MNSRYPHAAARRPRFGTPIRITIALAIVLAPLAAQAYVGPGAGLSLLSALWGLLCAIGAAFLFIIMWPIRRLRRRRREAQQQKDDGRNAPASAPVTRDNADPAAAANRSGRESDDHSQR